MLATSVKLKGYSCFKDNWVGFDEFKPITVIIGRNNTGKSHLLDMVELLTTALLGNCRIEVKCSGVLDDAYLKHRFSPSKSGGKLSPDYGGGFNDKYSHWNYIGKHYVGHSIEWTLDSSGKLRESEAPSVAEIDQQYRGQSQVELIKDLADVKCLLFGKRFRRIYADRDIAPEAESVDRSLNSNGTGATNLIRRQILSRNLDENLIQKELLAALQCIFGADGDFQQIEPRHDDESNGMTGSRLWEIFLGEPLKGALIPLSNSGSGLKTILLVLLNLLVIPHVEETESSKYVFAFEELENNLHPALLRRLLQYITRYVERHHCYLFLTTHSNVALDFFGTRDDSQIIHVTHNGKSASAKTISTHFDQVGLLTELGARPSDLLQANGVVWLEGPSDRYYVNRFIELYSDGQLREGRDYQCAFYGGSNLANTTFANPDDADKTFANLLRLNNNIAVICDGDRTAEAGEGSRIKKRVQRIKQEVEEIPNAYLWITDAKEIENYIPGKVWGAVYNVKNVCDPAKYDRFPSSGLNSTDFVLQKIGLKSFDKCDFAMKAVEHLKKELLSPRFEFDEKMTELVESIQRWNR